MQYVIVFARCVYKPSEDILIIKKIKPDWMRGRLNLPGGKIEKEETPEEAAIRELEEESGLEVADGLKPIYMGRITGSWGDVHCIRIPVSNREFGVHEDKGEEISWMPWSMLRGNRLLIPNLRVVIPLMAMGVQDWVVLDEGPSWDKETHTIGITVKSDKV